MKRVTNLILIMIVMVIVTIMSTKIIYGENQAEAESYSGEIIEKITGIDKEEEDENQGIESLNKEVEIRIVNEEGKEESELEIGKRYTLEIVKERIRESVILLDEGIEIVGSEEYEEGVVLEIEIKASESIRIKVDEYEREYRCKKREIYREEEIYYLRDNKEQAYEEGYVNYIEIEGNEVEYKAEEFKREGDRLELIKDIEETRIKLTNEKEEIEVRVKVKRVEIERLEVKLPKEIKIDEEFEIEVEIYPSYTSWDYDILYEEEYITKTGERYKGIKAGKSVIEVRVGNQKREYVVEIKEEMKEEEEETKKIQIAPTSNRIEEIEYEEKRIIGRKGKTAQIRVWVEEYDGRITIESEEEVKIYGSVIEINLERSKTLSFRIVELDLCFEIEVAVWEKIE